MTRPRWRTWNAHAAAVSGALTGLYGAELGRVLTHPPDSALFAEGSAIAVQALARSTR